MHRRTLRSRLTDELQETEKRSRLGTIPGISDRYRGLFTLGNQIILWVFILEAAVKMIALAPKPQRYFLDGWNVFDFAIITLEGWVEVNNKAMELNPFAWVYFVSFVIVGKFVVVNLFIAVVINNLDRAKEEALKELEPSASRDELLRELRSTQDSLRRLETRISDFGEGAPSQR